MLGCPWDVNAMLGPQLVPQCLGMQLKCLGMLLGWKLHGKAWLETEIKSEMSWDDDGMAMKFVYYSETFGMKLGWDISMKRLLLQRCFLKISCFF